MSSLRPFRTRIKFCGLVRAEDVRMAVSLGVDAIGMVFYPRSPRALDPQDAAHLRRLLPSWVQAVGLFVNEPSEQVRRITDQVGLDVLQFHGDETPAQCRESLSGRLVYWRAVRMRGPADLLESASRFGDAEALLLDAHTQAYGGSGTGFDWSWVSPEVSRTLIVSGGLDAQRVGEAIAQLSPAMVDVSSGIQGDDPRTKDAERMIRFAAAVADADAVRNSQTLSLSPSSGSPR